MSGVSHIKTQIKNYNAEVADCFSSRKNQKIRHWMLSKMQHLVLQHDSFMAISCRTAICVPQANKCPDIFSSWYSYGQYESLTQALKIRIVQYTI
jgi:hypothetical protein